MKEREMTLVAVADTSPIIRYGLAMLLKRLPGVKIQPIEVLTQEGLNECLRLQKPDIVVVNPYFEHYFNVAQYKKEFEGAGTRFVALVSGHLDKTVLERYDDAISIFDDKNTIAEKINALQNKPGTNAEEDGGATETLSQREREIVICVVKGMTNKEIAKKLYLSIHTVITHRRNISRKLQIHTPSGLTIFAIINKLVTMDEVKGL